MGRTLHQITAIRRMRISLLLPLLLILSQHGAWLHELSHAAYAANPHQVLVQGSPGAADNGVCPLCQSFGQLGSALSSSLAQGAARASQICPQAAPQYSSPAAQRCAPRNRGPPHLA
jgi:hypothetical protein